MGKRDDILNTATALFNEHGYHAVGVDLIRDSSKVSKMTLYKYFPTKAMLIEAVLKHRHQLFKTSLQQSVEVFSNPEDQFFEIFNWHIRWFVSRQFHGCMFIKAAGEFHEISEYLAISCDHKKWLYGYIRLILERMEIKQPCRQANYIQVMLDGMIVNVAIFKSLSNIESVWNAICESLNILYRPLEKPGFDSIVDSVF